MSSSDARPTDLDDDGRSAEEQGRAAGASEPPAEAPSPLEASVPPPSAQASAPPAARSGDSASAHGAVPNRDEEPPPSSLGVSALRRDNRRLLLVLAAVLALGAMVGGVVWWRTRALLPPPDEKLLEKVAAVNFTELPPHLRSAAAAETLAELEAKRLPRALVKALEGIPRYPPSMRTVAMLEAFTDPDVLSEWKKTCEEGPAALGKMATLAPLEQGAFLYRTCELARLRLLDESEARAATGAHVALAAVVADFLERHRALSETEKSLLRWFLKDTALLTERDFGPHPFGGAPFGRGPRNLRGPRPLPLPARELDDAP
jgi:hypothetical protein